MLTPTSPSLSIPSTKISSPVANGCGFVKPLNGVSKKQVTIPDELVSIELIPTPFELLIAMILWLTESKPLTGAKTLTSDIVWFGAIGCNDKLSTTTFETGLNTIKLGALI